MDKSPVCFSSILAVINALPGARRYWIAYSGGLDSTVLLHLFAANRQAVAAELIAVHVDHRISPHSGDWARHCENLCRDFGVPLQQITVDAGQAGEGGPEAHARKLRYTAIRELMDKQDVLFTAHHQDDLAETFLLQLMRGAGPEGLAGMPRIRMFGEGWLARPLLDYSRKQLEAYARHNDLRWIEDNSNLDPALDRNYVRNQVMPCLRQRWPATARTIARSATHQADMIAVLKELAEQDLQMAQAESAAVLKLAEFEKLPEPRRKNLLRYWLKVNHHPVPGSGIIQRILSELVGARVDAMPCLHWRDTEVRRYRNRLYVMRPLVRHDKNSSWCWRIKEPLDLGWGCLQARPVTGQGIKAACVVDGKIEVRFRQGGETIHPAGRSETHKLKKLFQEAGVPPWQRCKIPLLYINDRLAVVSGYWTDAQFKTGIGEAGWEISWREY